VKDEEDLLMRRFVSFTLRHKTLYSSNQGQLDGRDMQRAWGILEMHTKFYSGNLKGRNDLGDLGLVFIKTRLVLSSGPMEHNPLVCQPASRLMFLYIIFCVFVFTVGNIQEEPLEQNETPIKNSIFMYGCNKMQLVSLGLNTRRLMPL
jgi:hypothetical protein